MNNINSEFDLEMYRDPNDTQKQWRLKSQFILKFHDKFKSDRLACLAQCYVNIETLGCRYSNELMDLLKELTVDFKSQETNETSNSTLYTIPKLNESKRNNKYDKTTSSPNKVQSKTEQTKQIQILSRNLKEASINNQTAPTNKRQTNNSSNFQTVAQLNTQSINTYSASPPKNINFISNNNNTLKASPNTSANQMKFPAAALTTPKQLNSTKTNGAITLACPSSTTEQSPAPSNVPLPFGLATSNSFANINSSVVNKLDFNSENLTNDTGNNNNKVLYSSLFSSKSKSVSSNMCDEPSEKLLKINTLTISDPLSKLMNFHSTFNENGCLAVNSSSGDSQFQKLAKINKLRNMLRTEPKIIIYVNSLPSDTPIEIIEYFKEFCYKNNIKLDYVQYVSTISSDQEKPYLGELYIESFRLIKVQGVNKKLCSLFAHKKALLLLYDQSELAVHISSPCKRDSSLKLDDMNNNEIEFDFELYLVNSDQNATMSVLNESDERFVPDQNGHNEDEDTKNSEVMIDKNYQLNTMLRSLLLPTASVPTEIVNETENITNEDDDNEDDENDENLNSSNKKIRIREAMPNFCIFLASTEFTPILVNERNSISILTNSCTKSNCSLEFELKIKGQQLSIKMQLDDSDEEHDLYANMKKKYKCKCFINNVKISSVHGKSRNECKRQAALKALTYLSKLFPVLQDPTYLTEIQQLDSSIVALTDMPSSNSVQQRYFKISKEDLFKGLVPPTLFETLSNNLAQTASSPLNTGFTNI